MNDPSGGKCYEVPTHAPMDFILPFDAKTEVVCTHARGETSHSWPNAFWSLDLATPYEKDASLVRAAASGTAYVLFDEDGRPCKNPPGTPRSAEADRCGKGWGNSVKIDHGSGYYSFYVHLETVRVKNGAHVKQGEVLGTEGWTGAAGHRHLHWSVNRVSCANPEECAENLQKWDGMSVPFRFTAVLNGKRQSLDTSVFDCEHANIGMSHDQPRLRGTVQGVRSPQNPSSRRLGNAEHAR
jgi:murein DD-endopeptidase MepM/ murein hydrolase activator NlpD